MPLATRVCMLQCLLATSVHSLMRCVSILRVTIQSKPVFVGQREREGGREGEKGERARERARERERERERARKVRERARASTAQSSRQGDKTRGKSTRSYPTDSVHASDTQRSKGLRFKGLGLRKSNFMHKNFIHKFLSRAQGGVLQLQKHIRYTSLVLVCLSVRCTFLCNRCMSECERWVR